LEVRPVRGRIDLERFIRVPFWLHQREPMWVPPLIFERRQFLNRRKNPYFEHAEAELFLCERDGEPVGRISAQVDERWDEYQGGNDGMFGFFDAPNDPDVARALVETAAGWLRDRGRERALGPMDFTTNDECGLLVDGYEHPPIVLTPWHPPYYKELIEATGMSKEMDLLMWNLALNEFYAGDSFDPTIHRVAKKCESKHGVTIRKMRRNDLEAEIGRFMEVYNAAWSRNWGFVPVTDEEVAFYARNLRPILDENWAFIAERDGEVLGAALSLPDVNQVLAEMGGRLLPLGWLKFLLGKRRIDRVRVFALGVKPEYQILGVAAALYVRHLEAGYSDADAIWHGETGWILETNMPMNRGMERMGGHVTRRYRLYSMAL
jgi:GNAT superfamily N-acetyltransferase